MVDQHWTGRGHETVLLDFGTVQITVKDMCSFRAYSQKTKTHTLRTEATLRLNGLQLRVKNVGNILAKLLCPGICVRLRSDLRASPPDPLHFVTLVTDVTQVNA